MAEYIVTVKKGVNWKELHSELKNDTSADSSVDSSIIPDREVPVVNERPNNPRNTHYDLTDDEAKSLLKDSRVAGVDKVSTLIKKPSLLQEGEFNKGSTSSGQQDNWGLLRHISKTNNYGTSTSDPGGTYDYVLDGTGVDVVITDTGIQADHPEWEDKNGVSRLKQIDWYSVTGQSGSMPANHYTDTSGHGTHVAGTVAGKTFGWAKNADIYVMKVTGSGTIPDADMWDMLVTWHQNKGTGRPTVVNMSWGYVWYMNTNVTPNTITDASMSPEYQMTGGRYRGTTHSGTTWDNAKGHIGEDQAGAGYSGWYGFPRKVASQDAEIETLVNAGIHVVMAAGNDSMKMVKSGDPDYDNYIEYDVGGTSYYAYYHRGGSPSFYEGGSSESTSTSYSPTIDENDATTVGALWNSSWNSTTDRKASFSNSGNLVDIYAAGTNISSAYPTASGQTYHHNSSFKQEKLHGTSMACPQICGMYACLLQAHPDWTPKQIKDYFVNNAEATMYDSGSNSDYLTNSSIHGGNNRTAYFPMSGQKPWNFGG